MICLTIALCCFGQEDLAKILSFEVEDLGGRPGGWTAGAVGAVFVEDKVVHSGRWSARLERTANSAQEFSAITRTMSMDFTGTHIELRGWLKTEDVSGMVGLWLREGGESGPVGFDNMASQQLKGTHDWAHYSVSIPVRADATGAASGLKAGDVLTELDGAPVSQLVEKWKCSKRQYAGFLHNDANEERISGGSGCIRGRATSHVQAWVLHRLDVAFDDP